MVSPLLVPVWVAGLLAPFRRAALAPAALRAAHLRGCWRSLYIAGDGKAYYLASLYPVAARARRAPDRRVDAARALAAASVLAAAIVLSAAISALIALPLLPERVAAGERRDGAQSRPGRDGRLAPLRRHGVDRAGGEIPPRERRHTAIFTAQLRRGRRDRPARPLTRAAARLQRPQRLQRVGPAARPPTPTRCSSATTAPPTPRPYFDRCRTLATINNGVGLDNDEQGLPGAALPHHRTVADAVAAAHALRLTPAFRLAVELDVGVGVTARAVSAVDRRERRHVVVGQLEVEDVDVLARSAPGWPTWG